ncbi:hypothetical protein PAMA_009236 [Pampus argenteus]
MLLFWVMLWSTLPPLGLLFDPDTCSIHESSDSQNVSPLLESLQCHNDYKSYIHCKWKEAPHTNTTAQLWFKTEDSRKQCEPYGAAVRHADRHTAVQCRYNTRMFAIGIKHTVFFLKNKTLALCSVPNRTLDLSQHLRVHPPVDLSTHDAGDGGRRLIWSSPYPSLSKNLTYQLSYRPDRQDNWTTEDVTSTTMTLEKRLLLPGCRYEARVRGRVRFRASVSQWSKWSPMVTWHTEEDVGQFPSLHCMLDGEDKVTCSWEVSRELAHIISYQLSCRDKQTATSERCCENLTVTHDLSRPVIRYSCSLTKADPENQLLELLLTHKAKTYNARKHIRPNPPQEVKVREKDRYWVVEWTEPNKASKLKLYYQVCYYRKQHQGCSTLLNISECSMTILDASLVPSQQYQVKVRSLVVQGEGSHYDGTPSEWTGPKDWTSHAATWSFTTLIYFIISVFVATVFCTLYYTIPACQRKVILWVESVPSPGKSKILSEVKSATNQTLIQSENTYICKVLDSLSTCSSDALLWPAKDTEKKHSAQHRSSRSCDNLHSPDEKIDGTVMSSCSFSGPYVLCQTSNCESVEAECEEKKEKTEETSPHDSAFPPSVNFALYGEGYVCLPSCITSRSTQDLVSHSDANTSTHRHDNAEQDQQCRDNTPRSDSVDIQPGLGEPTSTHQPPANTSGPFTSWPQGESVHVSGYCLLLQTS